MYRTTIQQSFLTRAAKPHDDLCIATIELPVWREQEWHQHGKPLDLLDKWLYFLTGAKGSDSKDLLSLLPEPEFAEGVELMSGFTKEEKRRHAYDMRQNYERLVNAYIGTGYEKGLEAGKLEGKLEGKQEGLLEGKLEDARLMLADGLPVEQVLKYTGLERSQLEKAGLQ